MEESKLELIPPPPDGYDEMLLPDGTARPHYLAYQEWIGSRSAESMQRKRAEADLIFRRTGIMFSVYGDETGTERLIPSDVVPRILSADDWSRLEKGLIQRVKAINRFLSDIYHQQDILRAGLIPADQILINQQYQVAMVGVTVPHRFDEYTTNGALGDARNATYEYGRDLVERGVENITLLIDEIVAPVVRVTVLDGTAVETASCCLSLYYQGIYALSSG